MQIIMLIADSVYAIKKGKPSPSDMNMFSNGCMPPEAFSFSITSLYLEITGSAINNAVCDIDTAKIVADLKSLYLTNSLNSVGIGLCLGLLIGKKIKGIANGP